MRHDRSIILSMLFLFGLVSWQGQAAAMLHHLPKAEQEPTLVKEFKIFDLGETDLGEADLTRQSDRLSLGPRINDQGEIIGNTCEGGFVYKSNCGKYFPKIKGAKIHFYALNHISDILMSITRFPRNVEWFIWPTASGCCENHYPIDTVELEGYQVQFFSLNDAREMVGAAHPDERTMAMTWSPEGGLKRIGPSIDLNILGGASAMNWNGTAAGKSHCTLENFPFVWNGQAFKSLYSLRQKFGCPSDAKLLFHDLLITSDGSRKSVVYGTYQIDAEFLDRSPEDSLQAPFLAFKWNPSADCLQLIDLGGMRISAMNCSGRIVGSLNGSAVYIDSHFKPNEILAAVDQHEVQSWELLEATDINDSGQIVGYGKKNGQMHLFLAQPLR